VTHGTTSIKKGSCRILVGKPEGQRPLGRHRCKWEDNIKVNLKRINLKGMDRITVVRTGTSGRNL